MEDLTTVIKENLEKRGVLNDVRARVRAEVFKALDDKAVQRPKLIGENMIINELIREYLLYNNYHHTLSVLVQETRQPEQPLDRTFLSSELHMKIPDHPKVPLLYGVVSHFTDQHSDTCEDVHESAVNKDKTYNYKSSQTLDDLILNLDQPKATIIQQNE